MGRVSLCYRPVTSWVGTDGLLKHEMGNIAYVCECLARIQIVNLKRVVEVHSFQPGDEGYEEIFPLAPLATYRDMLCIGGRKVVVENH